MRPNRQSQRPPPFRGVRCGRRRSARPKDHAPGSAIACAIYLKADTCFAPALREASATRAANGTLVAAKRALEAASWGWALRDARGGAVGSGGGDGAGPAFCVSEFGTLVRTPDARRGGGDGADGAADDEDVDSLASMASDMCCFLHACPVDDAMCCAGQPV